MQNKVFAAFMIHLLFLGLHSHAQPFSLQDTLRGSITPERAWWDLTYYHLDIEVNPEKRTIFGKNTVQYRVLDVHQSMQIDLQEPLAISRVVQDNQDLTFERLGHVYYIDLKAAQKQNEVRTLTIYYGGTPVESLNPPWSGGVSWEKDHAGNHFIATSCQGIGPSIWWPCKDHAYDEVDSMLISVTVPEDLTDVSNGRLRQVEKHQNGTHTFHWFVSNPINHYGVNINIADYVHFSEVYKGEKGDLDCDYYVLRSNEAAARKQFKQVPKMFEAFEHWFGPYPFYEDGFKLVEVPYLGMEHQSSVTYGNGYMNGYRGSDLSGSGWGMKFDFIIIHEAGHEWFANSITHIDIADMWIHEGFTAYSENLYLDYHYGQEASADYVLGTRNNIQNDRPVIGSYRVANRGSSDMYYKGANLLHMLRQITDNDEKWRQILRKMNREFYHQTVSTQQVEAFLSQEIGRDLSSVFDQYLRDTDIPILEYRRIDGNLLYRWGNCVDGFDMPVRIAVDGETRWINPTPKWQFEANVPLDASITLDRHFYAASIDLMGK